jgi:hypothetical protein
METVIINTRDKKEYALLKAFLKQSGIASRVLSKEEKEDLGLLILISQADRQDTVPLEKLRETLNRKIGSNGY